MRLTILRCPPYAYHQPHDFGSKQRYDWIDQGYQEFTLAICPHIGGWQDNDILRRARRTGTRRSADYDPRPCRRPPADGLSAKSDFA